MNASEFINKHQLGFHVSRIASRPGDLSDWARDARHWEFSFRTLSNDRAICGHFSQGSAHKADPTAADVLGSLALDARCFENASDVIEFANEFGYDLNEADDQDRARKIYEACGKTLNDLRVMLGDEAVDELWEIDFDE